MILYDLSLLVWEVKFEVGCLLGCFVVQSGTILET
jgi:hypothetical protein